MGSGGEKVGGDMGTVYHTGKANNAVRFISY